MLTINSKNSNSGMTAFIKSLFFLAVLSCTGCATNWYSKFYEDYRGPSETVTPLPDGTSPVITHVEFESSAQKEAVKSLLRKNYRVIGQSGFYAAVATEEQLIKHAREIGAEVVLHSSRYMRTKSGVMSVPQYNPGQTYQSNFSGYSGGQYFYGSGTTRSSGSFSNQYVPYSVDLHEYTVLYLVKSKEKLRFGIRFRELNSSEKQRLESNKGVAIHVVVNGSPAYDANLLEGDLVTAIGGQSVTDSESLVSLLNEIPAGIVKFQIIRKGESKVIEIQVD